MLKLSTITLALTSLFFVVTASAVSTYNSVLTFNIKAPESGGMKPGSPITIKLFLGPGGLVELSKGTNTFSIPMQQLPFIKQMEIEYAFEDTYGPFEIPLYAQLEYVDQYNRTIQRYTPCFAHGDIHLQFGGYSMLPTIPFNLYSPPRESCKEIPSRR
ncbi:hypothetical protein BH10PSE19_BH10PSE19_09850 [soil metagenome]